ncbi:MAG: exodeoxyribonuclease VII large subunit [Saezia sp.]
MDASPPHYESLCWSVSGLINAISDTLKARFSGVTIRGEISAFSRASSGHCYFILKDEANQIRCAMFQRTAQMLSFAPANGDDVELKGRLVIYGQRGELQLMVESMCPLGQGRLLEQFQQLKNKLEQEGLFAPSRKRKLPAYPQTIGIITSLQAAALHDVLTSLKRRAPHVRVIIYPALVQGSQAVSELVGALAIASKRKEADLLLICRGGGSLEDLWSFNEEAVVRAVAACALPVISGVGHETDFTLTDFAVDVRAPTPTAAAELATPTQEETVLLLKQQEQQLQKQLRYQLEHYAHRIDRASLSLQSPAFTVQAQQQKLRQLTLQLSHACKQTLAQKRYTIQSLETRLPALYSQAKHNNTSAFAQLHQRWQHQVPAQFMHYQQQLNQLNARLNALNPSRVLARGYAWITNEQGHVISSSKQLQAGQTIQAQFADGKAQATITQSSPELLPPQN